MLTRFEPEPRVRTPRDFVPWLAELQLLADTEGETALLGTVLNYAPAECVQAFTMRPALWAELLTRARYTDEVRWCQGVRAGKYFRQ